MPSTKWNICPCEMQHYNSGQKFIQNMKCAYAWDYRCSPLSSMLGKCLHGARVNMEIEPFFFAPHCFVQFVFDRPCVCTICRNKALFMWSVLAHEPCRYCLNLKKYLGFQGLLLCVCVLTVMQCVSTIMYTASKILFSLYNCCFGCKIRHIWILTTMY